MKSLDHYKHARMLMVDARSQELYKSDYSPYNKDNFEQYLRELVENEECVALLFEHINTYQVTKKDSELELVGRILTTYLATYWDHLARREAETEIPSAIDMMGDERGSGHCNGR